MEFSAYSAIGLGTLTGGWRIIHTWEEDYQVQPMGGFAAETGAAVAIFTATHFGVGVSTTHTITGAIVAWVLRVGSLPSAGVSRAKSFGHGY